MKWSMSCALIVSMVVIGGCRNRAIETQSDASIRDHNIPEVESIKITFRRNFDSQHQEFSMDSIEEHYIDFKTQKYRIDSIYDYKQNIWVEGSSSIEIIVEKTRYKSDKKVPNLWVTSPYIGHNRPWVGLNWWSKDPERSEIIAGVECDVFQDHLTSGYVEKWTWNRISLKELIKSDRETTEIEAIELIINPLIDDDLFEIPKDDEIITWEEEDRRRRALFDQLNEQIDEDQNQRTNVTED